ncbi:D-aminopeptidase [Pararhizobium capsulatum DSM 1112]|uniref:D-aminopeptidase n=1 Tax=Pararhizobium capsulatum DSM 1112 TaxID=1121113 RepID=A0ABU0BR58_9HYPH|nr:D-aminopeptidase [Pararhizobium capsulatum]MDQ0320748.1 D-aminopeptidase [Pararhizobium capsulatum DSM 1112]
MSELDLASLENAVRSLPNRYKGPGGVVGVVKDGKVILKQAWGYADLENRRPMDAGTLMPICSISKQFTCAILLDLVGDPAKLDHRLAEFLPNLKDRRPTVADLCNNQSGLRDYWAMTVLHGAAADGVFRREDALPLLARMTHTHFAPGSHYSYSNGNFRILLDLIETESGRPLAELYREKLFGPAGMKTAVLAADTSAPLNGVIGYEGSDTVGFFPAANRIFWSGDAGIAATLDDMLAWEIFIDSTRDEANGIYNRISTPQPFSDGTPSRYGYGIAREDVGGIDVTGHGGALRGFRARRLHSASERVSVVVMFNHDADAHAAALSVMKAALGQSDEQPKGSTTDAGWSGSYLDPASGLVVQVTAGPEKIEASFAGGPETLTLGEDGIARSSSMTLARDSDAIRMERAGENLKTVAVRITGAVREDIAGHFVSDELGASLDIVAAGNAFCGSFDGFLGKGAMHPIYAVGEDVWVLACRRSMDAPAPGDWTIRIHRDDKDQVKGLTIGCWLARHVDYRKAV